MQRTELIEYTRQDEEGNEIKLTCTVTYKRRIKEMLAMACIEELEKVSRLINEAIERMENDNE